MTPPVTHSGPGTSSGAVFAELVEELTARLQAGGDFDVEAYLREHAEQADRLRDLLPALRMLGELSASASGAVVSPGPLPDGLPAGRVGDFRILREVGRGGMGVVYEAEQVSLGRRVALKVLPLAATLDPRHLQRFQNEARAAACLHHTNIVPVYSVGNERGVHFYAMQFIDGRPLSDLVRQLRQAEQDKGPGRPRPEEAPVSRDRTVAFQPAPGEVTPAGVTVRAAADDTPLTSEGRRGREYYRRVAELGVQAAEALDHAHQLGIVHRDVKPANLLLDAGGRLWVTDFGLAHVQHGEAGLTMTGDLVGTLRYMSPEQALAKRVVIDHRTDIYSLGATLYELLTLRPAFPGGDRQELLRQIAFEEPKPPCRVSKAIPAELEIIVLKALEKNPAGRYATAKDLADDLRHWLEYRPIRARRPSLVQRARKWAQRHKPLVVAAAVCLLVTLVAGGGSAGWVLSDRAARQREAQARVREAEGKVQDALEAAAPGLREGNPWDRALISALERAEAQLGSGLIGEELWQRVAQLRKDVQMLAELEKILLDQAAVQDGHWDHAGSAPQYARAFRAYGMDVEALGPEEAAALVQRSAIREYLVAGLDDWAYALGLLKKEEASAKAKQLLAVAQQVDPDPWRNRLRGMMLSRDLRDLGPLVRSAPVEELPRATLGLLAEFMAHQVPASEEGIEVLRRAQRRFPADFWANEHLGLALEYAKPQQREEAIGFYRAAVALRPQSPGARVNLGNALRDKGDVEGAITEYREALRLKKDYANAHNGLCNILRKKGDVDGALAECREALRLRPDYPEAHDNLGAALYDKGDVDGAIAEFKEALRLKKDFAFAHCDLGAALHKKGDVDGALAEYREALRLRPDFPEAHDNLGNALAQQGRFRDAAKALRRGHELGSRNPGWRFPSARWLRQVEQLAELDARLSAVLAGKAQPKEATERLVFARLCQEHRQRYAAAERFFEGSFAAQPALAENPASGHRYNAARAAALAGCGQGQDAADLDVSERTRLRKQALDWLRADLAAWRRLLEKGPDKARPEVAKTMQDWLKDADFAGVRGEAALGKLPEAERPQWQKLWAEVESLRRRAAGPTRPPADARPQGKEGPPRKP